MNNIFISEIVVKARGGGEITNCIKESIRLATERWENVRLIHNNREYSISVDSLMFSVKESPHNNEKEQV